MKMKQITNFSTGFLMVALLFQVGCAIRVVNPPVENGAAATEVVVVESPAQIHKREAADRAKREAILAKEIAAEKNAVVLAKAGEAFAGYEVFLEQHKDSRSMLRAPALKRLGDLKMEKARLRFIQEMEAYDITPDGPPPLIDYAESIALYKELLNDYPQYAENDQVLYALSRAYGESGETEQALPLLESLITRYPEHPNRFEAYFRLGEFYFDRQDYDKATVAYERVASSEDPYFQDKALYKLAWSFFKLELHPQAIALFLKVVDQKTEALPDFAPEEGSLVWEALTYTATSFRKLGGPSVVANYFHLNGTRRYEREIYLTLANHYMVEQDLALGVSTYQTFVKRHAHDPMAPFISSYVMEAYNKYGQREAADIAREALVVDYDIDSPWYQANDEAARLRSRPLIKSELHRIAISAHAKAQKEKLQEKKDAGLKIASTWYQRYLRNFPKSDEALEIQFLLGETLMATQAYEEAGAVYEKAAFAGSTKKANRKAAYSAVIAYGKVSSLAGQAAFLAISKRFAKHFPDDPEAPVVLFKVAESLFDRSAYLEAAAIFEDLLIDYPQHATATTSRKLVAHSYMKAGAYRQARVGYREVLAGLSKKEKKKRAEISGLLVAAIYKEAEAEKKAGALLKAAELFEEISREVPQHVLAPEALFEAALLYENLKTPRAAIRAYRKIARDYAKSDLVERSYLHAGLLYEASGAYLQAAAVFIAAAEMTADLAQAEKLIWSAAGLYEQEKNWEKTFATYLSFIQRFPKHEDAMEALFKMAEIRQNEGRVKAADKLFLAVINKGTKAPYYGKARLALAERDFESFKSIEITAPLALSFKKKTKALKGVIDLYTKAIESRQIDIVTVSSYRLGQIFEHFQSALLEAEAPEELDEEQLEEYRFQLEEKAYPFEEKAIRAYESNVARARRTIGLFNEWVKKSYKRLAELRPARYRRKEQSERIVLRLELETLSAGMPMGATVDAFAKR